MDEIDKLLKHVTDNTDEIISQIEPPACTEEEFFQLLLEMVADGELELIKDEEGVKFKLADKYLPSEEQ